MNETKKIESKKENYKDLGVFYLSGEINESSVKDCIEFILNENVKNKNDELTLIINSSGGSLLECFALLDVMSGSKIPIKTVGIGCLASCGLTIFLFGYKKILTTNTFILSHQYSTFIGGKYHELLTDRKTQDWMHNKLIDIYSKKTKLNKKQVESLLLNKDDNFITAKQALKYGICDQIKNFI